MNTIMLMQESVARVTPNEAIDTNSVALPNMRNIMQIIQQSLSELTLPKHFVFKEFLKRSNEIAIGTAEVEP